MFEFIADHRILDLVATVSERSTAHDDRLRSAADLAAWVEGADLVDGPVDVDEAGLRRTQALREASFRLLSALIDGTAADPADRALVNAAAAAPRVRLEVDDQGQVRRTGDLDAVLAELACDCLVLHGGPDRALLHWCADETCTRPFVDRSRGGRRRWCGMKGCGDRAKAAAYRERRRSAAPTAGLRSAAGTS